MTIWELKMLGYMAAAIEERPEWIAVSSFRRVLREQGIFRPEMQDTVLEIGRDLEIWQLTGWSDVARYIAPGDIPEETIRDELGFRFSRIALRYGSRGRRRGKWAFPSIRRLAEWRALGETMTFV